MAINTNFNIYEPEAWTEVYLANQYPARPMVSQSVTNVAGANIEGLVSEQFKEVKITRPVKTDVSQVNDYNATKNYDTFFTPEANELSLRMDHIEYLQFKIDKADQRFALPDLVNKFMVPAMQTLFDKINLRVKLEALKFEAAVADYRTGAASVIDDADLREIRRILKKRKNWNQGAIAVVSPDAEADLTGISLFHQADQRGNSQIQLDGNMGRAFGFDFYVDNLGSDFTAATGLSAIAVSANAAVGAKEISIDDTAAGAAPLLLSEGDVIYFGTANGRDDHYVVASQSTTKLFLKEPLRKAVADDATINAVDVNADGATNEFFYDPRAIALVTAVMGNVDQGNGGIRRSAGFDPTNRVNYTLTVQETKAGADVLMEILYGTKLFYPDLGVRYIRGTQNKA